MLTENGTPNNEKGNFGPIIIETTEMDAHDAQILMARDMMESEKGMPHYRRLFFEMALSFASNSKNDHENSETADMMHIFELMNG